MILDRLLGASRSSGNYPPSDRGLAALFGGGPTAAGVKVDEFSALNYSAWWFGTRLISEAVASLPLLFYRRLAGGGKEREPDEPLFDLLHDEPNPESSSFTLRETMQSHLLGWGNGYSEIERNGAGRPLALWLLTPDSVCPDRDKAGRIVYRVAGGGSSVPVPADRMLHVPGLGWDGARGYGVVTLARQSIGLGLAAERFGSTLFGNDARPSGILEHAGTPEKKAREELKASWTREHGREKANSVGVLWGGWKFNPVGIPPEDAQFLETRAFQREEVGLWLNIPPFKLGVSKAATYASVEQFAVDFVVHTIRPWLTRWEGELRRKLLTKEERREFLIEHLVDALLRGDLMSRTAALAQQFQHGVLNEDEWREIENRNPLPDGLGQKFYVPLNMRPVDEPAGPEPASAGPPEAPPEEPPDDGPAPDGPPAPDGAAMREAAVAVLADTAGRLVRKETAAARRAAGEPRKFLAWIESFYPEHQRAMALALVPSVQVVLACSGRASPPGVLPARLAEWHCRYSRDQLLDVAGHCKAGELASVVARLMDQWEVQRPAGLAARLEEFRT